MPTTNQVSTARKRLKQKLGEQLEWLTSSAASYDQGRTSEAIRLAGVMRTLFAHSRKSAGLVFQLGGGRIFLNSTVPTYTVEPIQFCGLVDFILNLDTGKAEAVAPLDGNYVKEIKDRYIAVRRFALGGSPEENDPDHIFQLRVHKWLNQPVVIYSQSQKLTREDLFMTAANEDGAAHVHETLSPNYEQLQRAGGTNFQFQMSVAGPPILVGNVHLPALRQMAFELITSTAVLALAN